MDDNSITSALQQGSSNLRVADIKGSQQYLLSHGFEIQKLIGCGGFGAVMLAKKLSNSQPVAIKLMYIQTENDLKSFTQEYSIMKTLQSQYTVSLLDILIDTENNWYFLIMEFYPNGNLQMFIQANQDTLTDQQIAGIFLEILQGLVFLKQHKIIHGDLKPQNILISTENSPILADFGLSTCLSASRSYNTKKGSSLSYSPIEQEQEGKVYPESDVFSAGMVLFNMCGQNSFFEMIGIKLGNFPNILEKEMKHKELVKIALKMMAFSRQDRPTPEQVIEELQRVFQVFPKPILDKTIKKKEGKIHNRNYPNGNYQGEFKDNKRNGYDELFLALNSSGKFQWKEERYEGEWRDDKMNGTGKYFWNNGDTYEGEWKNDKKHGKGKFLGNDGSYDGEWRNDLMYGIGQFVFTNGDRYEGEWQNNKKKGYGKFFWNVGDRYEGEWKNDKKNGKGIFYYNDRNRYEGDWKDDMRNGQGTFFWIDGDKYEGEWQNDKKHGKGKLLLSYGDRYEGEYKEDLKHGKGIFYFFSGNRYEGEFADDSFNGNGRKLNSAGKVIEQGIYKDSQLVR